MSQEEKQEQPPAVIIKDHQKFALSWMKKLITAPNQQQLDALLDKSRKGPL
jgi:hypothetical protein